MTFDQALAVLDALQRRGGPTSGPECAEPSSRAIAAAYVEVVRVASISAAVQGSSAPGSPER
jgi:hypothetical protein